MGPFPVTYISFRGIRLVEQTEQNVRRARDCLEEKPKQTRDCNSRALLF